jgi:hypothetical protein
VRLALVGEPLEASTRMQPRKTNVSTNFMLKIQLCGWMDTLHAYTTGKCLKLKMGHSEDEVNEAKAMMRCKPIELQIISFLI